MDTPTNKLDQLEAYRNGMAVPQERFTDKQVYEIRYWQAELKRASLKGDLLLSTDWQKAQMWVSANADVYGASKYRVHREELMKANK